MQLLAGEITQVKEAMPWVRCASGNVFFKDPIFIWEKGNLGALGLPGASLLLGEVQKVVLPFGPPGARKTPEMARFGRATGKIELTAASAPKFRLSDPLESSGLMKKRPATAHFRRKSVYTCRRSGVDGAGGTKVPFRCNSLRQSAPAG